MAKTLSEAAVTTKNARAKLARGIHWRGIDPDVHLGYRKGVRGGRWVVRWYRGENKYFQQKLATADDVLPANGADTLDFSQAVTMAREIVAQSRADAKAIAAGPAISVRSAINEYIDLRKRRNASEAALSHSSRDARSRLTKHVLSHPIADKPLHRLEDRDLRNWKEDLPKDLAAGTIRRLVNDFKASLNHAAGTYRKNLPPDFTTTVKFGLRTEVAAATAARRQILSDSYVTTILRAAKTYDDELGWSGDLYRMIHVLAATGARMSQVVRLTVGDVQPEQSKIIIPVSFKGRGSKNVEHVAFPVAQNVIDALQTVMKDRSPSEPLLERWRHKQVAPNTWEKDRRGKWKTASELTRPWAEIIKRTNISEDTLPYALRHSSIVRGLRNRLPTRLVAALHDTSTAMIEKHYSAFVTDAMNDLAAQAVVALG